MAFNAVMLLIAVSLIVASAAATFFGARVPRPSVKEVAVPSVFLFRLATFWLPVLPGWLAFHHLTRRGML